MLAAVRLVPDEQLDRLERHLAAAVGRTFAAEEVRPLRDSVRTYVTAGGKRLRPQLCLWVWSLVAPNDPEPTPALLDTAAAWELFHAFLLVHDDIIDGADTRRGRPALHRQLQSLDSNCPRFGLNLGIVAGDLLFSASVRLLHELDGVEPGRHLALLRLFSGIACTTGFGQAIDIFAGHAPLDGLAEAALLREYDWKTAAYTFEGPMLSAAILAGCDAACCGAIRRFATSLGQAYQLHNDLADLAVPVRDGSDLLEGKRTTTLLEASRRLPGLGDRLKAATAGDRPDLAEALRQDVIACGATDATRRRISRCVETARAAAETVADARLSTGMTGLLGDLQDRYLTTV